MRNKRTLQRGLALLLAGGMALSNLGAVPALAEEYTPATEVTQTAPEEEVPPAGGNRDRHDHKRGHRPLRRL